mmetsp:Transcript_4771/g.11211  ORF Transcript_4771/g.11211 Transcript_4771/m.11211 type:complete len:201 (-) Transcript_4771:463-1065(-)
MQQQTRKGGRGAKEEKKKKGEEQGRVTSRERASPFAPRNSKGDEVKAVAGGLGVLFPEPVKIGRGARGVPREAKRVRLRALAPLGALETASSSAAALAAFALAALALAPGRPSSQPASLSVDARASEVLEHLKPARRHRLRRQLRAAEQAAAAAGRGTFGAFGGEVLGRAEEEAAVPLVVRNHREAALMANQKTRPKASR